MKLSVNNLYVVSLWAVVSGNLEGKSIINSIKYVRKAVVYKNKSDDWYDLETGDKYKFSTGESFKIGSLFINMNEDILPLTDFLEFEKNNLSKRKILKKVMNTKIK